MIPAVASSDSHPRHFHRQEWMMIPSMVAIQRKDALDGKEKERPVFGSKSADELCAASVLISLSPKEVAHHHPRRGPRPSKHLLPQKTYIAPIPAAYSYEASPVPSYNLVTMYNNQRWRPYPAVNSSWDTDHCTGHVSESVECSSEGSVAESSSGESSTPSAPRSNENWFTGSISLSLPEDDDVLSPLHCFMRRYCVEAFSATQGDVATPRYGKSHGVKVVVGQVGIRCLYCKHRSVGCRPERAVCYPSSLKNIYHSIETWQRRHSLVCQDIPTWVRKSIVELMASSRSRAGGRRQYWEDSAMRLGMIDTADGVRFSRPPGDYGADATPRRESNLSAPVVREDDRELVTEFLFLLMEQMETCKFTEEDRTGGRSKIKDNEVGFPGMQCKHCYGKAGFGRYFPTTVGALALANSDRNIYNHIQKCRRCPSHIKTELVRLSKDHAQAKNRRGSRKMFFNRVWERIHGPNTWGSS